MWTNEIKTKTKPSHITFKLFDLPRKQCNSMIKGWLSLPSSNNISFLPQTPLLSKWTLNAYHPYIVIQISVSFKKIRGLLSLSRKVSCFRCKLFCNKNIFQIIFLKYDVCIIFFYCSIVSKSSTLNNLKRNRISK